MIEINEQRQHKLKATDRKYINKLLGNLTSPNFKTRYFKEIPLGDINDILAKRNMLLIDGEEGTPWSGFLVGRAETVYFDIAYKIKDEKGLYTPIVNSKLFLQWYKMDSGKYEITAYLS